MANPTTNFGWVMPTSTSLVTNLPADFNTFGQGVDTSMAQLKGGTTGQILSKTSATDMAFTWITPNPGDITGVTAGTGISGGGTSGDVTITNSMATAMTTKGDLVPATGSGTFSRLAVGTNGQTLVADSTASTGLKWATPSAAGFNGALARNSSSQSIPNATWTAVIMDSEIFDSGTYWDTSANTRFTIPTTGKYSISANALSTSTGSSCYMAVWKNGSAFFDIQTYNNPNGTTLNGTNITLLTAGDYIQLYVFQNQGSAATYYGNGSGVGSMQWSITFLGA